jgi:hypothetical protein
VLQPTKIGSPNRSKSVALTNKTVVTTGYVRYHNNLDFLVGTTDISVKATVKSVRKTVFGRLEHKSNCPLAQQILFFGVR